MNKSSKITIGVLALFAFFGIIAFAMMSSAGDDSSENYKVVDYSKLSLTYPKIEIKSDSLGAPSTILDTKLYQHTFDCLIECESVQDMNIYSETSLVDDVILKDSKGNIVNIPYKLFTLEIESYIEKQIDWENSEETCEQDTIDKNNTIKGKCAWEYAYKNVEKTRTIKVPYVKGETKNPGNWKIGISLNKLPNQKLDYIFLTNGVELSEMAWWNTNYNSRKIVNITGDTAQTLYNFTVYINVTYDSDMQSDFDDLRFVDGVCSGVQSKELGYEIDSKANSNYAGVWVKIPILNTGTNQICMYYGNDEASSGANSINAWDDNYTAVWHFTSLIDSKQNSNLTAAGTVAQISGTFGYAYNTTQGSGYFNGTNSALLTPSQAVTFEMFVTQEKLADTYTTAGIQRMGSGQNAYWLGYFNSAGTNKYIMDLYSDGASSKQEVYANTTAALNTYNYIVFSWLTGNSIQVFENKSVVNVAVTGSNRTQMFQSTEITQVGRGDGLGGLILDEVRISNVKRSSGWMNRSYNNMDFSLFKFGAEENINLEITFDVRDSYSNVSLNDVSISCNYTDFNQSGDTTNPYGPYGFPLGNWECEFEIEGYYDKIESFIVNDDKIINIKMSQEKQLTVEEHTWLEALYNCVILKDCDLYNLLLEINQTTGNIWEQTKPTDQSVVTFRNITNKEVNSTRNLTIDYTINIPIKAGYAIGTYLPVRIGYWFLNETNTTCYNQGIKPTGVEDPYCQPLVIETLGPMGGSVSFTAKLHPSLPTGDYNIKEMVDIDPNNVWINYGQDIIGSFLMTESLSSYGISLTKTGEKNPSVNQQESGSKQSSASITGAAISNFLLTNGNIIIVVTIICITFIVFVIITSRTILKLKKK